MVGQNIGKYRVLERVGRGGMGTVYRAIDETLHREVAIKVLNAELNDPAVARRFKAEAVTVARLNHPGIATIYELFQNEGEWLMVMEFVRGETLEALSTRKGALSVEEASELCMQVLAGLAHAHGLGVVHRDLKPANLMVTEAGTVKIMDFGIARVAGTEHLTSVGFMMGTPAYMAPEQVLGQDIDARADLYAIGVVLYHLTTGKLPFKGDTPFEMAQSRIRDEPTPVRSLRAELPPWVGQVMELALARDPTRRFQSAPVFREALRRGLANLPLETPNVTNIPPELVATAAPGSLPIASRPTPTATAVAASLPTTPRPTPPVVVASPTPASSEAPTTATPVAPASKPGAPSSNVGMIAGIAAAVVLVAAGGWAWMRSRAQAPAPAPAAVTAQAPSAPPPAPVATPGSPSSGDASAPAAAAAAPSTSAPGRSTTPAGSATSTPGAVPGGRAAAPNTPTPGAAGSSSASTTPITGRAVPGAARGATPAGAAATTAGAAGTTAPTGRGRAGAAATANDSRVMYGDLHALVVTGKNTDEQQVSVHFFSGQIMVILQKGGATLSQIPYHDLVKATYVHQKSPKWDPMLTAPSADVDMPGGLFRSSRHWLTLQAKATYVILRLNDEDYQRVLETVTTRTGLKVDQPSGG